MGRILGSYELVRVLGRTERFAKPVTVCVRELGYYRMDDSNCRQKLVEVIPSVGKYEVDYVKEAEYGLVRADVARKMELYDVGVDMYIICAGFRDGSDEGSDIEHGVL